jgi:hypothetical protein
MSQSGQTARPSGDRWRTARAAQHLLASGNDTIGRVRADDCAHEGPKCRQRRRVRRRHSACAGHVAAQNATGWNVRMAGLLPRAIGDSRRVPGMADDRRRRSGGRGSRPRQDASHRGLKHEHICNDERNPGTHSVPLLTEWTDHALADFRSRGSSGCRSQDAICGIQPSSRAVAELGSDQRVLQFSKSISFPLSGERDVVVFWG